MVSKENERSSHSDSTVSTEKRTPPPNGDIEACRGSLEQPAPTTSKDADGPKSPAHPEEEYLELPKGFKDILKGAIPFIKDSSPHTSQMNHMPQHIKSLDDYPEGYGRLAAYEDANPSFLIARKFKWLHNYLLIWRQYELAELERQLEAKDRLYGEIAPKRLFSRQIDTKLGQERIELMDRIDKKLAVYDELLFRVQQVNAIAKPTDRNRTSLHNFIRNTGSQAPREREWTYLWDDLAALGPNPQERFRAAFETCFKAVSRHAFLFLFRSNSARKRTGKEHEKLAVDLVSDWRIDLVVDSLVTILATTWLLAPIILLSVYQSMGTSALLARELGIIFGFTLGFAGLLASFTKARKQEIFTATAGYAAVLVVFLGNLVQTISERTQK